MNKGTEVATASWNKSFKSRREARESFRPADGALQGYKDGGFSPLNSRATRITHDCALCGSSSVGDSDSLITTAFVTNMSGCCCLASCIAIARA